jgi:hypothetical protein
VIEARADAGKRLRAGEYGEARAEYEEAAADAVPALLAALSAAEAREARLREALMAVLHRSATSATRTLGEASDELAMCQDIARAALATGEQG